MLRLLAFALVLAACAAPAADRLDPALSRHLATVGPDVAVDVLVGLADAAPATAVDDLAAEGLEVRTVAGDVVVARGPADAVRRVAALPWVASVARSQERPPLTPPAR